ncbi:metal-dependent phosphohydrolase, partial [filamentous cyanobacterium CCP2]
QSETALCGTPTADHLGQIASLVVDYLQTGHSDGDSQTFLEDNLLSNELQTYLRVAQLIDQTDLSNPNAAAEVATLAEAMGQLLDLPAWQLHRLRLAGLLYRIALLRTTDTVLAPGASTRYQDESASVPLTCSLLPGIQVLRRMQRLRAIATILTHQSEWWNGTGQPAGLVGDEIPVESRILGLVIHFQQQLAALRNANPSNSPSPNDLAQVFSNCRSQQGDRWDPKLIEALGLLVTAMQQGLSLPVALPKIASGLWMLDPTEEMILAYQENLTPHA